MDNIIKKIWKTIDKEPLLKGFPPFIIFGVAIILVPIFVLMTMDNIREQNDRIVEKLTGKGIFLIRAFEAGARTGMLNMSWNAARVQNLITETSLQPEVEYMMITSENGKILVHSDPDMVGKKYDDMPPVPVSSTKESINSNKTADLLNIEPVFGHREINYKDNQKIFQVFKKFTPAHRRFRANMPPFPFCIIDEEEKKTGSSSAAGMNLKESMEIEMKGSINMNRNKECRFAGMMDVDWFRMHFVPPKHGFIEKDNNQIIFAALDMSEVELGKAKYLRHVIAMGFMFFVLGCTGIVGIFTLQGYRSAKTSISELKGEIERSRRLAAVGKLAAGVAHEIRNPLSSIKGLATYFKERYHNVEEDIEVADIMIQEVDRLNRSITQLLEFAKPLPVIKKDINLMELISHSIKLIEHDLKQKQIKVVIRNNLKSVKSRSLNHAVNSDDLDSLNKSNPNKDIIKTDPDRLNQILLNLYLNAMQAMDINGILTIRLFNQNCTADNRFSTADTVTVADNSRKSVTRVVIAVSDTGKGIDKKDIEHIFDPYFTNRPDGTGLGLAMVHRAVEALEGEIDVKSEQGKGTTFYIRL